MRILSHYFIARFLGLFATALIVTLVLLATIELVLNFDDLSAFAPGSSATSSSAPSSVDAAAGSFSSSALGIAVRFIWVRLASYYLPDLVPIASFTAAFITFAWAGRAMELVAIQAGGIRLARVVIPVLGAALILSLATIILHETLILHAERIWSSNVRGQSEAIDFGRQAFWYHKGRTITNVKTADASTRTLYDVEIFERTADGDIVRVVRAPRVHVGDEGLWQIEKGRIWTFDPDRPEQPPQLSEHASMKLDLDARGDALLGAEPGLLPLPSLAEYLESGTDLNPSDARRLRNRYHDRLSEPWLVLFFAFLAVPFGLRVDRSGRIMRPALGAAAVIGLYFLIRSAGNTLSQEQLLPVGWATWACMALFGTLTLFLLRGRSL